MVRCGDGEDLPAGAAGVLRGGVEQHADLAAGVGQVGEPPAGDGGVPEVGRREPDHDPHGRRLAGAVGTEEAGHPAGRAVKVTSSTAVNLP